MATEATTLDSRALASEPLADKKTLRRVLVASSLGTRCTSRGRTRI
jgi:hypothetical protein